MSDKCVDDEFALSDESVMCTCVSDECLEMAQGVWW